MDDPGNGGTVQDGYLMKTGKFLIPLCLMVILVLAIPAIAAADTAQVSVTPTDTIAPTGTVTPVAAPGFDPLGSLALIVGIRKDNHNDKEKNANLTKDIRDTQQESPKNWWDSYNIIDIVIGNRPQVIGNRAYPIGDPALNLTPRPKETDKTDLHKDAGNASLYRADTPANRSGIMPTPVNLSVNPRDTRDLQNTTQQNSTIISEPLYGDVRVHPINNASLTVVPRYTMNIQTRQQ